MMERCMEMTVLRRQGKSLRDCSGDGAASVNTARKYPTAGGPQRYARRPVKTGKLDPFQGWRRQQVTRRNRIGSGGSNCRSTGSSTSATGCRRCGHLGLAHASYVAIGYCITRTSCRYKARAIDCATNARQAFSSAGRKTAQRRTRSNKHPTGTCSNFQVPTDAKSTSIFGVLRHARSIVKPLWEMWLSSATGALPIAEDIRVCAISVSRPRVQSNESGNGENNVPSEAVERQ